MLFTAITEEELLSLEGNVDPNINKSNKRTSTAAKVAIGGVAASFGVTGAFLGELAGRNRFHNQRTKVGHGKTNKLQRALRIKRKLSARASNKANQLLFNNKLNGVDLISARIPIEKKLLQSRAGKVADKVTRSVRYGRHWGKIGAVAGGTIAAGTALAILRKRQKQRQQQAS